jgi:hypothetical protein
MALKKKLKILFGRLLPRNKIARFLVLEIISLLVSLFLFVFLLFALLCTFSLLSPLPYTINGEYNFGRALGLAGAAVVSVLLSLVCSIPLGVWVHVYAFKKFFIRSEKKDG